MDLHQMSWRDIHDRILIQSKAHEEADEEYLHRLKTLWAIEREMQDKDEQGDALKRRLKLLDETPYEKILLYLGAKWLFDGCPVDTQDMEEGDLDSLLEQVVSKIREEFRGNLSGQLQVVHDELDDLKLKRDAVDAEMKRFKREFDALTQELVVLGDAQWDAYVRQADRNKLPALHELALAHGFPPPVILIPPMVEGAPLEQGREVVAADVAGATSPLEYGRGEVLGQDGKVAPTVKSSEPTENGGAKTPSPHEEEKKQQPTTTTTKTTTSTSVAARRGKKPRRKQQGKS